MTKAAKAGIQEADADAVPAEAPLQGRQRVDAGEGALGRGEDRSSSSTSVEAPRKRGGLDFRLCRRRSRGQGRDGPRLLNEGKIRHGSAGRVREARTYGVKPAAPDEGMHPGVLEAM